MTATDELRRMLDERGVEWSAPNDITHYIKTMWRNGPFEYTAVETSGGEFSVYAEHRYWLTPEQAIEATLGLAVPPPPAPDQPPYDVLLDILASEWGIDASWDGLRRFWCVELNDEGVRKRDELHAENAKLRELVREVYEDQCDECDRWKYRDRMRELGVEVDG